MFGGGQINPQQAQEFINRYQQGDPSEGYSNQEVAQQFSQAVPQLSPQQFQQAAMQAFQNMSPQQREQFGQAVQQQAQQQGFGVQQMQPGGFQDPNALAQYTTQVHQQQPGFLGQLLGGAAGGAMGGGLGGAVGSMLGGGQQAQQGQTWETLDPQTRDLFIRTWGNRAQQEWEKENAQAHSPFNNPAVKAGMAGIAAFALRSLVSGGR